MDDKRYEKFINILNILTKLQKEQDIIDKCHNKTVENRNVEVYIGPIRYVNIIKNFMNHN